jgi:hypothetical protein
MYKVTGQVLNVIHSPKTEKYEESWKVQLLGDSPLVDGQVKKELLTLNVPRPIFDQLQTQNGKIVTLPIGFYVKNNVVVTFYPKHEVVSKGTPSA